LIARLTESERAAARRFLGAPAGHDASSDGRFTARPDGDRVLLGERAKSPVSDGQPEKSTRIPARGFEVEEATVADDGQTVAFVGRRGKDSLLAISDGGAPRVLLDDGLSVHSPDLSPDGKTIAVTRCYDVVTVGLDGSKTTLAKMPDWAERVEYLPSGRLMVEAGFDGWGTGRVPILYVVEPDGKFEAVADIPDAEALGLAPRAPMLKQYEASFPGTSAEQRADLLERFGYNTPSMRILSPDKRRMVFDVHAKRVPIAQGEGVYVLACDGSAPRMLAPGGDLREAHWSDAGKRVALVLHDGLSVAEGDGSRVRQMPPNAEAKDAAWSPDERYYAFHVKTGDSVAVYVYDCEKDGIYPVLPRARVEGWRDGKIEALFEDGTRMTVPPFPIDPEQGVGLALGGGLPRPPGQISVTDEYVDLNGVRVPRKRGE